MVEKHRRERNVVHTSSHDRVDDKRSETLQACMCRVDRSTKIAVLVLHQKVPTGMNTVLFCNRLSVICICECSLFFDKLSIGDTRVVSIVNQR